MNADFIPCRCGTHDEPGILVHRCPAPHQLRGDLYVACCSWCGRGAPFVFAGCHRDDVMPEAVAAWNVLVAPPVAWLHVIRDLGGSEDMALSFRATDYPFSDTGIYETLEVIPLAKTGATPMTYAAKDDREFPTLRKSVAIGGNTTISTRSVHLQDDVMQVSLSVDAFQSASFSAYFTTAQARELAAALIATADHHEAVRQEKAA